MDGNIDLPEILRSAGTAAHIGRDSGLWVWLKRRLTRAPEAQRDHQAEMYEVLKENALDTLGSLHLTAEKAIQILGPDFEVTDLAAIDPTWGKHWLSGASKVAADDHERQEWWARLIAGELKQSGSYSLRAMAAMDVLSRDEATLFTQLAPYVWEVVSGSHASLLPKKGGALWRPRWDQMAELQEAGLATVAEVLVTVKVEPGRSIVIRQPGTAFLLQVNKAGDILETDLVLTQAGKEILSLTSPEPVPGYLEEVVTQLETHCTVSPIVASPGSK